MSDTDFINEFSTACDAMAESKIMQAGARIRGILSAITRREELRRLFESVIAGYNFDREFSASRVPSGLNGMTIRYPQDKSSYIAFVFFLLYRMDGEPAALQKFLLDYYYSADGINTSYDVFTAEVVAKFKRSVLSLFDKSYITKPVTAALDFGRAEQISNYFSNLINAVGIDAGLTPERKEEFLLTAAALKDCIAKGDYGYVPALYIGVINTFACDIAYEEYISQVGKLLTDNGLL